MADPFALPDPFADLYPSRRPSRSPHAASYPPLPEAEMTSAVGSLTDGALSGLSYVGSELDKLFGGRAVRGFLAGKPREILSAIPGSDMVGLTDEADTASGRDVLEKWGVLGANQDVATLFLAIFSVGDVAGFAADVLLDPSTYLGGIGALTKAGQAAKKTGTLTRGFLPAVRSGERTLMYGLHGPGVADAAGAAAAQVGKYANVGLNLAEKVPVAGGVVRGARSLADQAVPVARSLFDAKAGFVPNRTAQGVHEFEMLPQQDALLTAARGQYARSKNVIQPFLDDGMDFDAASRYRTATKEGVKYSDVGNRAASALTPDQRAVLDADAAASTARNVEQRHAELAAGAKSAQSRSVYGLQYDTRQSMSGAREASPTLEKFMPTTNASQKARLVGTDLPGGQVQFEDLSHDPRLAGAERTLSKADAEKAILHEVLLAPFGGPDVLHELDPRFVKGLKQRASQTAAILEKHDPKTPFWNPDWMSTDLLREKRHARTMTGATGVMGMVGKTAAEGLKEGVDVPSLLNRASLTGEPALGNAFDAIAKTGGEPFQQKWQDFLAGAAEAAGEGQSVDESKALRDFLKGYKLPQPDADAAAKLFQRFATPEESRVPKFWGDSLLNMFKAGAYSIWPSAHGRNLLSGLYENAVEGTADPRVYADARKLLSGTGVDTGIKDFAGLTPDAQRLRLMEEMYAHGVIGQRQGELMQRVGVADAAPVGMAPNPSAPRPGLAEIGNQAVEGLKTAEGRSLVGIAGVGGRTQDTNALVRAGRDIGSTVEDNLRVSQFMDLRRQGFTPEAAKDLVTRTHFDYGSLSDFEKNVMKWLVPFYTFSRFNLPKQLERAVTRPATLETPLRAAAALRDDAYVPQYLQSGLALPLGGQNDDGTQRYLSQLGLPFEEAFSRLKVGSGAGDTAGQTLMSALSMLRPEVKVPLEFATGKQFMTGRDLADLRVGKVESLGGVLDDENGRLLSELLSGTPATRMISTGNRLLDERKGLATKALSLTTGAKLTDVDSAKWQAIDARHALEKLLQGQQGIRESVDYYATPDAKAAGTITPEQGQLLQLYAGMKQRARAAAQEKRVGVRTGG